MELRSHDGKSFAMTVDGYQFSAASGSGPEDWDANWLIIAGTVRSDQGSWAFRDPSLTAWEAQRLAGWLRGVADGSIRPSPVGEDVDEGEILAFTEPNLAFSFQARTADCVVLRVYLSLAALPEHLASADIYDHFVELTLSSMAVEAAAAAWASELLAYPVR